MNHSKHRFRPRYAPRFDEFESRLTPAAPVVLSIDRELPSSQFTSATSVTYTVTFDKPVTGVDAGDFAEALSGATASAPEVVTPISASVYKVTVNNIVATNGTVGLNLVDDNSIRDLEGTRLSSLAPAFANQKTFAVSKEPQAVIAGDFNGDGRPDFITSNLYYLGSSNTSLFLGNGDGSFQAERISGGGLAARGMTSGDFNADGKLDVAFATGSNSIAISLGNGDGTFRTTSTGYFTLSPNTVTTSDVNLDGKLDLIFAEKSTGAVGVSLGNGDGAFRFASSFSTFGRSTGIAIADLNGDGKPDLVAGRALYYMVSTSKLIVYRGNGDGTFQPAQTIETDAASGSVVAGDFNRDGRADIAVALGGDRGVGVLLGNGNGTLQTMMTFPTGYEYPAQLAVADVDRDDKLDLVLANTGEDGFDVLEGNGDGTFRSDVHFPLPHVPTSLAVTELNGDGRPDVIVPLAYGGRVSVVLGKGGDFTGQTYIYDQTPPIARITAQPIAVTFNTTDTFRFGGDDPVVGGAASGIHHFEYQLDHGSFLVAASPLTLTDLSIGVHTFLVRAVDNSGNVGPAVGYSWFVKHLPAGVQSINRTIPAQITTNAASVTFAVTFTKPVTGVDSGDFAVTTNGVTVALPVNVTPNSGSVYNVTVGGLAGSGTLGLNLVDDGSIRDAAGFPLGVSNSAALFQGQKTYAAGANPKSAVLADVNGDGKLDLLVANSIDNTVGVLLGNGNGTFQAQRAVAVDGRVDALSVGDVNGDGKPDLAVASNASGGGVSLLLGNGDGTFQAPTAFAAGRSPYAIVLSDLNGDGKLDAAVANKSSGAVTVLLNAGNGVFLNQVTFAGGAAPSALAAGDVNGDGKLDLVVADGAGNAIGLLLNNGDGTFQNRLTFATGAGPSALAVGDVNGDGKLDLAVANATNNSVSVLLGNGDGVFGPQKTFASSSTPVGIAIANLNGDGQPDLAVTNFNSSLSVLLGNGDGNFQAQATFAAGTGPLAIAAGDVNGDGRADLAITNIFDGAAGVYVNAMNGNFSGQTYNIDRVAPIAIFTTTPAAVTSSTSATFGFAANDPLGGGLATGINRVEYQFDNGNFSASSSPVSLANLSAGSHRFAIRAFDNAGNISATTAYLWTIEANPAPQVVSVTPNCNIPSLAGPQRSRIASLVVSFNRAVQLDEGAMALTLHTNNVSLAGVAQPNGYGTLPTSLNFSTTDSITWIVTFIGNTDNGLDGFHSLKDGVYDLAISAAKVHPSGSPAVAMTANYVTTFHRLFGDTGLPATPSGGTPGADFQAVINTGDNLAFRTAFNNNATYRAFLDFNGDGAINSGDNLQFRGRFNKSLTWRV